MELSIETKLYRLWSSVKARVTKDPRYINKGMYEVWLNNSKSFITYCKDLGYSPGLHIDRIDNNKGYFPGNVRFVTPAENQYNRTNNVIINFMGDSLRIIDLEVLSPYSLPGYTIRDRLKKGWSIISALYTPKRVVRRKIPKIDDFTRKFYKQLTEVRNRCYNPNNKAYTGYGGRGIYICNEWMEDKTKFVDWVRHSNWSPGLQLDRIDNDGPYSPENCRWVTSKENNNNKSNNHLVLYNGEYLTLSQICDKYGISSNVLTARIREWVGRTIEEIIETPLKPSTSSHEIEYQGNRYTSVRELCRKLKIKRTKLQKYMKLGKSVQDAAFLICEETYGLSYWLSEGSLEVISRGDDAST